MDFPKVTVFTADQRKLRELITELVAKWKSIVETRKNAESSRKRAVDKLERLRASKTIDQHSIEAREWAEDIEDLEALRANRDEILKWIRPHEAAVYEQVKNSIRRSPSCFTPELFLTGDPDLDRDFERV